MRLRINDWVLIVNGQLGRNCETQKQKETTNQHHCLLLHHKFSSRNHHQTVTKKKTYQQESYRSDTSSRSGVSRFRSWGSRNRTARGIHRRPRGGSPRPRTSSPPPPFPRCTGSSPSRDTSATRPTSTRRRRHGISRRVRGCPYRRRSRSAARCRRSGLPPDTGGCRGVPMRTMSWGGCIRSCMIF